MSGHSSVAAVSSLRSRVLGASAWVILGSIGGNVLRLASNLIVTRLLVPEMFGLMAIVMTVGIIMTMLSDLGLTQGVVRGVRGDDEIYLDTVWSVQVVRGVLLWVCAIFIAAGLWFANRAGAFAVDSAYAVPVLPALIVAGSFASVIHGFASTRIASAYRHFQLRSIVQLDFLSQVTGLVVMVGAAAITRSVWSLVAGGLINALAYCLLSHTWLKGRRNQFRWERAALLDVLTFGKWLLLSSAVTVFSMTGDRLILAAILDASTLGYYSIAISLVGAITAVFLSLFNKVGLPALSEVARKDIGKFPSLYRQIIIKSDPIIVTCAGLLYALADLIVHILYDARYQPAGNMLGILSFSILLSRYWLAEQAYLALSISYYQVYLNFIRLISICVIVPVAYYEFGLFGALVAISLKDLPALPLVFYYNARHGLNFFKLDLLILFTCWPLGYFLGRMFETLVSFRFDRLI